jgi:hypothetical protein
MSSLNVKFSRDFGTSNFSLCGTDHFSDGKSGYFTVCLDLDVISVMCVKQNNNRLGGLLVLSKPREWRKTLPRTIDTCCKKPHTHYTTSIRDLKFIFVTQFTPKIKLITFLNGRSKISPLKSEGPLTHT